MTFATTDLASTFGTNQLKNHKHGGIANAVLVLLDDARVTTRTILVAWSHAGKNVLNQSRRLAHFTKAIELDRIHRWQFPKFTGLATLGNIGIRDPCKDFAIGQLAEQLSTRGQRLGLGRGDQLLNKWLHHLGLWQSGFNLSVFKQTCGKISNHRSAMIFLQTQLFSSYFMAHCKFLNSKRGKSDQTN